MIIGTAAYNVQGLTIHKAFKIPVVNDLTGSTYISQNELQISGKTRQELANMLSDVKFLIIDEISMVKMAHDSYRIEIKHEFKMITINFTG